MTSSILVFEKLIQLWQTGCHSISLCQLLGLAVGEPTSGAAEPYPLDVLLERFRGTWWEVIWPGRRMRGVIGRDVQCKYIGDSFHDALRRRPHADFFYVDTADASRSGPSCRKLPTPAPVSRTRPISCGLDL
jgi:hypothetical protein